MGTLMLQVKAIDAFQPLYGLTALVLAAYLLIVADAGTRGTLAVILGATLVINAAFQVWAVRQYRRWVGDPKRANLAGACFASVLEPFTFRVLLHLGAVLGWIAFLAGAQHWGRSERFGIDGSPAEAP